MKLSKVYEPNQYEADIYALWEKSGVFTADPSREKERFSISMPPPNETGTLSIGHSLFLTLQDIMARYNRMKGKDVLWLPGTDHAALAVNAIIEKQLAEEGTDKHAIGREEFLNRTRDFVAGSRETMVGQMRAMGASADWSRQRYTLDEALNRCVNETFVKMYDDGLIYRGHRIVNWDPNLQTTVSDDEVVYEEEKTKYYTLKYGPFEISTARPETKFGDKYVIMHPDDERYSQYKHGDTFDAEWINGTVKATVIKDEAIDPEFGTGVMTITPWHSHADFEIAERHGLDKEQIIDFEGKMLPITGEFEGQTITEARPKIIEKLEEKGLVVKTDENYVHNIALNERGKGVIEPQIKLQWFVDVNKKAVDWNGQKMSLKEVMQSVVRDGDIEIMPKRFEKTYFHWIDNLRDWCVSRQIWWGHRIPVWYKYGETYAGTEVPEGQGWEQDPDTLDTWFSSALWTWSTLVDPEIAKDKSLSLEDLLRASPDFNAYHPTSVMETGWDILFFWVARMVLSTTYVTGQVPFKKVYLHGMVRAADGKKMSKSRPESIIDPLQIIPEYGTDALRMALIMGVSPGNDQNWSQGKIEANRNFCNKIWNIARYIEGKLGDQVEPGVKPEPVSVADHWVLDRLNTVGGTIDEHLANFRFSEAYDLLYHLIWDNVADWYIEASKSAENVSVLNYVLETILKLAHPFAPFVTETIWQSLHERPDDLLAASDWPAAVSIDKGKAGEFEKIKTSVTEVRTIKTLLNLKGGVLNNDAAFVTENSELIKSLAKLESVEKGSSGLRLTRVSEPVWLGVDEAVAKEYAGKLTEKKSSLEKQTKMIEARLSNESYVKNAPEKLVIESREQLEKAKLELESVDTQLKNLA